MKACRLFCLAVLPLLTWSLVWGNDAPAPTAAYLQLVGLQKEYLTLEPILVSVRHAPAQGDTKSSLPPGLNKTTGANLRVEITPAVKPRPGAKPLPFETQAAKVQRTYDLLEWFQFPTEGTFTVRLVLDDGGTPVASAPATFTIRRPGKDDPEAGAVARLHHLPWSNYVTDAFCGDTFDVVKSWPKSKLSKYCHFWNGLHLQNKKDYDKAIASYQTVVTDYPDFVLAGWARANSLACTDAKRLTPATRQPNASNEKR